jgi:hypothetical protein
MKYVLFGGAVASLGGSLALSAFPNNPLLATTSGVLAGLSLLLAYLSGLKTGYDAD